MSVTAAPTPEEEFKLLLTIDQTATALGVSRRYVHNLLADGYFDSR